MKNLIYFSAVCFSIAFIVIKISTAFPARDVIIEEPDPRIVRELRQVEEIIINVNRIVIIASPFMLLCLTISILKK